MLNYTEKKFCVRTVEARLLIERSITPGSLLELHFTDNSMTGINAISQKHCVQWHINCESATIILHFTIYAVCVFQIL